jgi:hypothetical protein
MTLGPAESRGQKRPNQLPSECMPDHKTPQADHVQIVVFDALMSRKRLMDQTRPNSRDFVRGH